MTTRCKSTAGIFLLKQDTVMEIHEYTGDRHRLEKSDLDCLVGEIYKVLKQGGTYQIANLAMDASVAVLAHGALKGEFEDENKQLFNRRDYIIHSLRVMGIDIQDTHNRFPQRGVF